MSSYFAFYPISNGANLALSTSASAATALGNAPQVRFANTGTVNVYLRFGGASVAATSTDMTIQPGVTEIYTIPEGATHFSAMAAAGTPTLNYTLGRGL